MVDNYKRILQGDIKVAIEDSPTKKTERLTRQVENKVQIVGNNKAII